MYPLAEGLFAPRNQWYIAAWSHEVTRQPMERWILNLPVAFYRTEGGEAVAGAVRTATFRWARVASRGTTSSVSTTASPSTVPGAA